LIAIKTEPCNEIWLFIFLRRWSTHTSHSQCSPTGDSSARDPRKSGKPWTREVGACARDRTGEKRSRGFLAAGTADRASCCGRPTERRGRRRSVRKCTPKRAVYWPRTKREVCYGALLPRVTTTTTTTYSEHHLSILPYHSAGCPSADKGATERNRRRNTRGGEKTVVRKERERERERERARESLVCARVPTTEISPQGTRLHVALDLAPASPPSDGRWDVPRSSE